MFTGIHGPADDYMWQQVETLADGWCMHAYSGKLAHVSGVEGVFWFVADWHPYYDVHHEGGFRHGIAEAYLRQIAAV